MVGNIQNLLSNRIVWHRTRNEGKRFGFVRSTMAERRWIKEKPIGSFAAEYQFECDIPSFIELSSFLSQRLAPFFVQCRVRADTNRFFNRFEHNTSRLVFKKNKLVEWSRMDVAPTYWRKKKREHLKRKRLLGELNNNITGWKGVSLSLSIIRSYYMNEDHTHTHTDTKRRIDWWLGCGVSNFKLTLHRQKGREGHLLSSVKQLHGAHFVLLQISDTHIE